MSCGASPHGRRRPPRAPSRRRRALAGATPPGGRRRAPRREPALLGGAGPAAGGQADRPHRHAIELDGRRDAVQPLGELLVLGGIAADVRALEVRLERHGVGDGAAGERRERALVQVPGDRRHAARRELRLAHGQRVRRRAQAGGHAQRRARGGRVHARDDHVARLGQPPVVRRAPGAARQVAEHGSTTASGRTLAAACRRSSAGPARTAVVGEPAQVAGLSSVRGAHARGDGDTERLRERPGVEPLAAVADPVDDAERAPGARVAGLGVVRALVRDASHRPARPRARPRSARPRRARSARAPSLRPWRRRPWSRAPPRRGRARRSRAPARRRSTGCWRTPRSRWRSPAPGPRRGAPPASPDR